MNTTLKNLSKALFLLLLLAACTENEMNLDTVQTPDVSLRSTQAECDNIQNNLPSSSASNYCDQIATLFECRLNQGVDEADVMTNCDQIDTYSQNYCISEADLVFNYQTIVNQEKVRVYQNTSPCSVSNCPPPQNLQACRIIIFEVNSTGNLCGTNACIVDYIARVYCCP